MEILKQNIENYLNSFVGDFKEIFFEKSKSFSFSFLNGEFRTPIFKTYDGFSILSKTLNKEYFKYFTGFDNIEKDIINFTKEFNLDNINVLPSDKKLTLKGEDALFLKNIEDINFDIDEIILIIKQVFLDYIKENKLISSSIISLNLSYKSFVVGNSSGNFSLDTNFYNNLSLTLVGSKNGIKEEIYKKITGVDILEKFNKENINSFVFNTINTLESQFDGIKGIEGEVDVIIGNESGGTIIHEAVGHGLEADLQNSSIYKGKIGEKVASELVTIVDNPTIIKERGYYKYDHEGNLAKNTILIDKGVLVSYLHNEKTADKFGVKSTGHGRKENYKYKSLVRMGNTYLLPGKDKKEDLIKKVKSGIYVSSMGGGQVNTVTGDFVFKITSGFLIENGVLTKNILGATISGNGPKMLNDIYGVCDDLNYFDGGTCGKGQSMPVSDATPTIWTKLKVSFT